MTQLRVQNWWCCLPLSTCLIKKGNKGTEDSLTVADVITATPPNVWAHCDSTVIICMLCTAEQTIGQHKKKRAASVGRETERYCHTISACKYLNCIKKRTHTKLNSPNGDLKRGGAEQAIDFIENTTPKSAARIFYNRNWNGIAVLHISV